MSNNHRVGGATILSIRDLSKRFHSVQALDAVDMDIKAGTIHALIGRNGSGKSTLIKILSGYHQADSGTILAGNEPLNPDRQDQSVGLAFVHQDLGIVGKMSVMENLAFVRGFTTRNGSIDWGAEAEKARASLEPFGLGDRIHEPMDALTKGEATVVAIARAVQLLESHSNALLVLDEPTSSLPRKEIAMLFDTMERLVEAGFAVLFVTHDLQEVLDIADYVTVLRDGQVADSGPVPEFDHERLVLALAGSAEGQQTQTKTMADSGNESRATSVLTFRGVSGQILRNIDLDVARGEIVGVTGLLGSGLDELAHIASARSTFESGTATFLGQAEPRWGRAPHLCEQIGFVPSDRVTQAVLPRLSVRENISIANLHNLMQPMGISRRKEEANVDAWLSRLQVVPPLMEIPLEMLSGGNQQKVIIGRWLSVDPQLLVIEGLTQGIDVVSKAEVLRIVRQAAATGMSVLLISYEFEEIRAACDRLLVLRRGRISGELHPPNITNEAITRLIS